MLLKPGKNPCIIFDALTKGHPHEVVLNDVTTTEFEANVTFGAVKKLKLLQCINNWRVRFPKSKIHLALADITVCFHFPRVHAEPTGAFGFMAKQLYFLATSMVFGSNASTSSWEPFWRGIKPLIIDYSMRFNLISEHTHLLDMLKGEDEDIHIVESVQAVACPLNPGIPHLDGSLEAYIYVDDILASAVNKHNILRLLAAMIEAIFTVCDQLNIKVHQCPLSFKKMGSTCGWLVPNCFRTYC
jgi:hypothetical protein